MTRIKQLLLLGAVFKIVSTCLYLWDDQSSGLIIVLLFFAFLIASLGFLWRRKVAFVHQFADNHPNISAFLYAIGWLPYFSIPYDTIIAVISYNYIEAIHSGVEYYPLHKEFLQFYLTWHFWVARWGTVLGLALAFIYVCRNWYLALHAKWLALKEKKLPAMPHKAEKATAKLKTKSVSKKSAKGAKTKAGLSKTALQNIPQTPAKAKAKSKSSSKAKPKTKTKIKAVSK